MLDDMRTVMWKELRELTGYYATDRNGMLRTLAVLFVLSVAFAVELGPSLVAGAATLGLWVLGPFVLLSRLAPDVFAGERERHTLESLLVTRLSDRSILLGKLLAPVLLAWGVAQLTMLVALVAVNIAHGGNGVLLYRADLLVAGVVLSLLVSLLSGSLGVLVSLRAGSVRQAQQAMGLVLFALIVLPGMLQPPLERLGIRVTPATVGSADPLLLALSAGAILLVLNAGLVTAAQLRFRRERLLLD